MNDEFTESELERIHRLEDAGVDMEDAMQRFLDNIDFVETFVKKLATDERYDKLLVALEKGDVKEAFELAHTLKGMIGNLSLRELYEKDCEITEYLRAGDIESARKMEPELTELYRKTVEAIKQL